MAQLGILVGVLTGTGLLFLLWRAFITIALPWLVSTFLVFRNDQTADTISGFYTHLLVNANEAAMTVRGSDGLKGGTIIKTMVNSPKYRQKRVALAGESTESFSPDDYDVVLVSDEYPQIPNEEIMGAIELPIFQKTGLRFKGVNVFDILFASVYRYPFLYTKENFPKDGGEPTLDVRSGNSYRLLLEEQTHVLIVRNVEVGGGKQSGVRVTIKGHFTFRIVNLWKPVQVAGQYLTKTRDQLVARSRDFVQQSSVDELLGNKENFKEAVEGFKDELTKRLTKELLSANDAMVGMEGDKGGTEKLWGIQIVRVTIEDFEFPPEVATTLQKIFLAQRDAEAAYLLKVRNAEANKRARELEGEGEKSYLENIGTGIAKQIENVMKGARGVTAESAVDVVKTFRNADALEEAEHVIASLGGTTSGGVMPTVMLTLPTEPKKSEEKDKKAKGNKGERGDQK